ncbi:DUF4179 domain-containing protein [Hazenella sp. IB182357]|uniref:DUF4179 domain-containing protein n=1 Tax=Polycladospora coralii TaxID=2771432 RepID=A0A926N9G6_9BACL|nr:DUF4179 domain-containing protein [Polycladospora coralii]MBD1372277.1 DUF4179 domain-containing protein [Polycladospora coralii]MBS7531533.1 DUF4179 domain-containing protein [Polycladospora coralii]
MKDIYELLNEVDIDVDAIEEMDVSRSEKSHFKRKLKKEIRKQKKSYQWKRILVAAVAVLGLGFTSFYITFPAYAQNLPLIRDIFRLVNYDNGVYKDYNQASTPLNISVETDGIKCTINEAIYDGENILITYTIKSDRDLGEDISMLYDNVEIQGGSRPSYMSEEVTKIDQNTYVGVQKLSKVVKNGDIPMNVTAHVAKITTYDQGAIEEVRNAEDIDVNWKFSIKPVELAGETLAINQHLESGGANLFINHLRITPMSFMINYRLEITTQAREKWENTHVELEVKDDLGNHYVGSDNGHSGEQYNLTMSNTYKQLNEKARKLIITPRLHFSKEGAGEVVVLEKVIVDLKK